MNAYLALVVVLAAGRPDEYRLRNPGFRRESKYILKSGMIYVDGSKVVCRRPIVQLFAQFGNY